MGRRDFILGGDTNGVFGSASRITMVILVVLANNTSRGYCGMDQYGWNRCLEEKSSSLRRHRVIVTVERERDRPN